jgi:hypothetical protein
MRAVTVELHGWPSRNVRCDVTEGTAKARRSESTQGAGWTLELSGGSSGRHRITLSGSLPLEQVGAGMQMPNVRIRGATHVDRWLGVAAKGTLRADGARGIEASLDVPGAWADPLRRKEATYWRVNEDKWALTLHPGQAGIPTSAVQLLLAEQECSVGDRRQWRFESTYWLYHEANQDLTVLLPSRSRLLGAAIDDASTTPLQLAPGRVWIPMPGTAGGRKIQVRWTFDDDAPVERPRLQLPQLEGVDAAPVLWTIHVPSGYQIARNGDRCDHGRSASLVSMASLELHQAACQLQLSTILADRLGAGDASVLNDLSAAQKSFYRACRHAEQNLALGIGDEDKGPGNQPLNEWLKALRDRNYQLARLQGFDSLRSDSELQAATYRIAPSRDKEPAPPTTADIVAATSSGRRNTWPTDYLLPRGRALHWHGDSGLSPPRLTLVADRTLGIRRATGLSAVWLIILMMVGLAAQFEGLRAWLRLFWPEQVVLLACIVWQAFGLNLLLVFLILLGVCGRIVFILQVLVRRLRRPSPGAPPTPVA